MKTAFLFSGQGSQHNDMGRELYENYSTYRSFFDDASDILGYSLAELCFGNDPKLNSTEFAQPAIYTMSMAILQLVKKMAATVDYYAGFSLGEYCAITAAGAIRFSDGVKIVAARGKYMRESAELKPGVMSAIIGLPTISIEEICAKRSKFLNNVSIANYNCPEQVVISGSEFLVKAVEATAKKMNAKHIVRLNVSGAFHTRNMSDAANKLYDLTKDLIFEELKKPVISNITAKPIGKDINLAENFKLHMTNPVKFEQSIRYLIEQGVRNFVEIGPGRVLSGFVKRINKDVTVLNIEDIKSFERTLHIIETKKN